MFTYSESTSILKNLTTNWAFSYAFINLSNPSEAERAIAKLSSKMILDRSACLQARAYV